MKLEPNVEPPPAVHVGRMTRSAMRKLNFPTAECETNASASHPQKITDTIPLSSKRIKMELIAERDAAPAGRVTRIATRKSKAENCTSASTTVRQPNAGAISSPLTKMKIESNAKKNAAVRVGKTTPKTIRKSLDPSLENANIVSPPPKKIKLKLVAKRNAAVCVGRATRSAIQITNAGMAKKASITRPRQTAGTSSIPLITWKRMLP